MPRYRLTLEYDGRGFEGWQIQPAGRRTVQRVLQEALEGVAGEPVRVAGASRTDAGVHAEGQVAAVTLGREFEAGRLLLALNATLPPDVAVVACARAADDFQPRFAALAKRYRYRIWNGPERSPLRAARWHWVRRPLDLAAMRRAAAQLVGRHDFSCFQAAGSQVRSSVRTLRRLDVQGESGGEVGLVLVGDGFLRHMVRIAAGTLIEVGFGRRDPDGLPALLAARERRRAGPTAPAHALTLERVCYGPG